MPFLCSCGCHSSSVALTSPSTSRRFFIFFFRSQRATLSIYINFNASAPTANSHTTTLLHTRNESYTQQTCTTSPTQRTYNLMQFSLPSCDFRCVPFCGKSFRVRVECVKWERHSCLMPLAKESTGIWLAGRVHCRWLSSIYYSKWKWQNINFQIQLLSMVECRQSTRTHNFLVFVRCQLKSIQILFVPFSIGVKMKNSHLRPGAKCTGSKRIFGCNKSQPRESALK